MDKKLLPYTSSLALLFCFLFSLTCCGELTTEDDTPSVGKVQKLELFLSEEELHRLYSTLVLDTQFSCSVIFEKYHGDGTIKIRGDSSRLHCKKSFTLKVDGTKYILERGQENGGLYNRIAMRTYQMAGLPACDTESVALFLNDEYLGCYNLITYYDEDVIGGELFRIHIKEYDDMSKNQPIHSKSKKKFPNDDDMANLDRLLVAVTNLSDEEWRQFVLDKVHIEDTAAYLAVHDFLTVGDTAGINFYIHFDGKYRILPWDHEVCLHEKRDKYYPCDDNQLIRRLAAVPEVKDAYNQTMQKLFTGGGASCILDTLSAEVATMFDNLVPAIKNDPVYGTSRVDFMKIKAYVLNYLDKNTGRATEVDKLILH